MSEFAATACACLGPMYGEPYCPCEMRRRGIPLSPVHEKAIADAEERLKKLFAADGPYFNGTKGGKHE